MSAGGVGIRRAAEGDLPAITEIYNEAVRTTTATFDTEEKSLAQQLEWLRKHGASHPVLVAELAGRVAGWASLNAWSDRCAYAETSELSFYVASAHRGRGIGRRLLAGLIEEARSVGTHTLLSRMCTESEASVHLHRQLGFEPIGVMREVGCKFGRRLDVLLMQRMLR